MSRFLPRHSALRPRLASGASLFLVLTIALLVGACASVEPVVKIGLVAPFEGRRRPIGYDAIYAARLAIREANAAGGVGGVRVSLVALDDGGNPQLARQAAASLVVDPDVVGVVGHGLPSITDAAQPLYHKGQLAILPLGQEPFAPMDPGRLPVAFRGAYAAVTPFDEVAGPYAGPTYDALWLLLEALELAELEGAITRESVATALDGLQYDGLTGRVFRP